LVSGSVLVVLVKVAELSSHQHTSAHITIGWYQG
jgi:hypothetical protein